MINDVSTRFGSGQRPVSQRRGFTLIELLICIGLILMLIAILLPAARKSMEAGRQISCLDHLRQIAQATTFYCMDNDGTFPSAAASGTTPQRYDWIFWRRTTAAPPYNDVTRSALARYLGGTNVATIFRCPSDSADVRPTVQPGEEQYLFSYSMNGWIGYAPTLSFHEYNRWLRIHDVVNPSQIILFVDEDDQSIDDGCWLPTGLSQAQANLHNELSIRHDVNHDARDPSNNTVYDQTGRGNVAFCDGHAEFVSRQFSFDWVGVAGPPNTLYRDHYQPTKKQLPPDVAY